MDDQKLENLLNLALDATEEERLKSETLNIGYDPQNQSWELIVKYHGDTQQIIDKMNGQIVFEELYGGYAVVTLLQRLIPEFAALEEIEYIEKPKRLFFSINRGKTASCITEVQAEAPYLSGRGVLIGIVDSGIDFRNRDFRNEDGTTRLAWLWDQSIENGVYAETEINELLDSNTGLAIDLSGHGTAVAGIAAGNGRNSSGQYRGVAYESRLIAVKMKNQSAEGFPRTTQLMRAVNFCVEKALELAMPIAINLSFGNTYGSHQGDSLAEAYLNNVAGIWKTVICAGSGNEGASGGHAGGVLTNQVKTIGLAVGEQERTLNIQLWKRYEDSFTVELISPTGSRILLPQGSGTWRYRLDETQLLAYRGEPKPYSVMQEIYIDFLPSGSTYINSGIWRIVLTPLRIANGNYNLYLPSESILSQDTRFLQSTPDLTLTVPSVAQAVITVAAYDDRYQSYAAFSGRGFAVTELPFAGAYKPTLAAPGVAVTSVTTTDSYASFSGTSFAAPFVTGAAALLMEWGIVRGNDPYLYGEKVKAYFIRGAKRLPGYTEWPNPQLGWGALCVLDSIPR